MSPAEIKDTLQQVHRTVKANASRPVATRPLMDRSHCTHPGCKACDPGRRR